MQTSASRNLMSPQEYFSTLQNPTTPRSSFDRGCEILTTLNAGDLVPIYIDEVLPADTWNVSQRLFGRILTLIRPLMDNLYLDIHWFFAPNRILWTHWVNMMGEQEDPANPISYTVPRINFDTAQPGGTAVAASSLISYMGIPIGYDKDWMNALYARAYYKTYDDWYRDENLEAETLPFSKRGDATVLYNPTNFPLLKRNKRKDYFTSALPWTQKGTAPTLSLGGSAPLTITNNSSIITNSNPPRFTYGAPADFTNQQMYAYKDSTISARVALLSGRVFTAGETVGVDALSRFGSESGLKIDTDNVTADLSSSVGFTLNAFREFATLQQYLELDARGGTRYVEHLYSFFGVTPEDARQQRVEYLGGQTFDLMTTPVPQTSESGTTPQGNLSGFGTFAGKGHQFVKSFTEDGIIIAIASIRQDLRYQQGIHKKFKRESRYDYYRPVFANLGEQPIYNYEIYHQPLNPSANQAIFGYQEAWAEYRYSPSIITGLMNSEAPLSVDNWHLGQDFGSLPTLTKPFIQENPPMARVIAVTDQPQFQLNGAIDVNCARAMPTRSIPGLNRL